MKKLLFFVAIATLISCKQKKVETKWYPDPAKVEIEKAKNSDKNFLFIPKEKTLTILNISSAKEIGDSLAALLSCTLFNVGVNNIFALSNNGVISLCTVASATHKLPTKIIGDSIALLDKNLSNLDVKGAYKLDTNSVRENEPLFVKGYVVSEDGETQGITLSTLADRTPIGDNKFILIIRVPKNVDLNNLVGAPVINRWNRVVGVFAGYILKDLKEEKFKYTKAYLFYN